MRKGPFLILLLLGLCQLAHSNAKGRQQRLSWDDEEGMDPEIKSAASLSHTMLQQLTDAVRTLLPLKDKIASQQEKIDAIYNLSLETKNYIERERKSDIERGVFKAEISQEARKMKSSDAECSEYFEYCRNNTKNALLEARFRCDSEIETAERKWKEKMEQFTLQQGGQMSNIQQGCEVQAVQLQTQCFTKMMDLSSEADKTIAELKAEKEKLEEQIEELKAKLARCIPDKSDFEYRGNVAKSAKGLDLEKQPKPTSPAEKPECEGFADPSTPIPPSISETGMNVGNSKQYIIGDRKVTWQEANEICKSKGMWLLTQENERDKHLLNVHVQKIIGTQPATFWMSARKEEGETWFMWTCYSTNQRPWRHTQNPKTDERCAHVTYQRGGKGVWSDDSCDVAHRYICQKVVY